MLKQWPDNLDWRDWVERYDRMQERYLAARHERFNIIVGIIAATHRCPRKVLDLGCGTGSLSLRILEAFPRCRLIGIDLDETLLMLAARRLSRFRRRVKLVRADLRKGGWLRAAGNGFDGVVSATALHWLSADQLAGLYRQLGSIIKPGGIFLNADHVASECQVIQRAWLKHREVARRDQAPRQADTWWEFCRAYAAALNRDPGEMGSNVVGKWEGVERGMPLAWHFDRLRESRFTDPECFWRRDCDAIYGAVRGNALLEGPVRAKGKRAWFLTERSIKVKGDDIRITAMQVQDYEEVYDLWKSLEGVGLSESDSRANIAGYLARNRGMSFVAREGRKIVGAVLCGTDGRRGYLYHLGVLASHRRRGIGKALVAHCLAALKEKGIPRCNLFVIAANADAIAFWKELGWRFWDEEFGVKGMFG